MKLYQTLWGHLSQGKKLSQKGKLSIPVDLIRTVAIVGVIVLHASADLTVRPTVFLSQQAMILEIFRWTFVDIYQSIGRVGVPLFVMLTGALLLQPSKNESLGAFFKKRWARLGLPLIFWLGIYLAWDFLVESQPFSTGALIQGVLTGPYLQFWYIYMLIGLYLLTPFLRVMVAHAEPNLFKYFIVIWFIGSAVLPFLSFAGLNWDHNVFTIPAFVGYYILGVYLLTVRVRLRTVALLMSLGLALTAFGTYAMAAILGGASTYFFQDYFSPTIIMASGMLFLLLVIPKTKAGEALTVTNASVQLEATEKKGDPTRFGKLLSLISANTLPIFLFHMIVLETFRKGYLGITINGNTINSIIGIPLISIITLGICLAVIVPLKKVPVLRNLLG